MDEPWVQYNGASVGQSQRIYLHTDHRHSVIAHSDGLGNSVNTLRYDVYGLADTNNVGRFGYTGQVWLADLGLYYYKARMYSPALGRFMQTDPIGYEDQMNLYAYVGNDPMNSIDPTGEFAFPVHGLITFFAALKTGFGFFKSIGIAFQSMWTDVGTQGSSKQEVAIHAMSAPGQDPSEARSMNRDVVSRSMAEGKLGVAAHAIQDRHASAHEGFRVWKGNYGGFFKAIKHILTDLFPSPRRVRDAYRATVAEFSNAVDSPNSSEASNDSDNAGRSRNSDNGMSSGTVRICSGMGAEKGGCR